MTYIELLQQREWHQKCQKILDRDKFRCQECGALGSHGNCYYKFESLTDIDELLTNWQFKGMPFSEFVCELSCHRFEDNQEVEFVEKENDGRIATFDIVPDVQWLFSFGSNPVAVLDIPHPLFNKKLIRTSNYYQSKVVSLGDDKDSERSGWLIYFEFEEVLSSLTILVIEQNIGSWIDDAKYSHFLLSITSGNKVVYIRVPSESFNLKGLNVHHNYYIRGKKPWEYPDDALVTLCEDCHKKRHTSTSIPLYDTSHLLIRDLSPCEKCGGSGYLPQYRHVENGVCFKCGGEGICLDDVLPDLKTVFDNVRIE